MAISRYIAIAVVRCSWAAGDRPCGGEVCRDQEAVSDQRTHAAGLTQRQRPVIVAFSVRSTARRGNISGQGEGAGLRSRAPNRRESAKAYWAKLVASWPRLAKRKTLPADNRM